MKINLLHRSAIISILSSFMLHAMESNEDIKKQQQQQQMSIKQESKTLSQEQKSTLDHLFIEYYPYVKKVNSTNSKNNFRSELSALFANKYSLDLEGVKKFLNNRFHLSWQRKSSLTFPQSRIDYIMDIYNKHKKSQNVLDQCATAYKNDNQLTRYELINILYNLKKEEKIALFENDVMQEIKKEIDPTLSQYKTGIVPQIQMIPDEESQQISRNELKVFFNDNIDIIKSSQNWIKEIQPTLEKKYGKYDHKKVLKHLSDFLSTDRRKNNEVDTHKKQLSPQQDYTFFIFCLKNIQNLKLRIGKNDPVVSSFVDNFQHWRPELTKKDFGQKISNLLSKATTALTKLKLKHEKYLTNELLKGIWNVWKQHREQENFLSPLITFMKDYNKKNQTNFPVKNRHFFLFVLDQATEHYQKEKQLLEHANWLDKKYEYLSIEQDEESDEKSIDEERDDEASEQRQLQTEETVPLLHQLSQNFHFDLEVLQEAPVQNAQKISYDFARESLYNDVPNLIEQADPTSQNVDFLFDDTTYKVFLDEKLCESHEQRQLLKIGKTIATSPKLSQNFHFDLWGRQEAPVQNEECNSDGDSPFKNISLNTKRHHKKIDSFSSNESDDENFEQKTGRKQVKTEHNN